jgi:hypothetical protein
MRLYLSWQDKMLTLHFIQYTEIEDLGSARRVKKILDIAKENKIVLLEGRLKKEEETDLIAITMEEIDAKFKGIELAVINPKKKDIAFFKKVKGKVVDMLLGDRQGFTIIGPATVVKQIKKDPDKIELFTKDVKKKK